MSYSFQEYTTDGVTKTYSFSLAGDAPGYISTSHISVYVRESGSDIWELLDGTLWSLIGTNQITLNTAISIPADGNGNMRIRRVVPKDVPYASFPRGSMLDMLNIQRTFVQQLQMVQELLDGFFPDGFYYKTNVNMNGHKFINMAPGSESGDSVNWDQWNYQEGRIGAIEDAILVDDLSVRTLAYRFISTQGQTSFKPGPTFNNAFLYLDGVWQERLEGAFVIADSTITFAEPLEEGVIVSLLIGTGPRLPDDYATTAELQELYFNTINSRLDVLEGQMTLDAFSVWIRDKLGFVMPSDYNSALSQFGDFPSQVISSLLALNNDQYMARKGHLGLSKKFNGIKTKGSVLSVKGVTGDPSFTPEVVNVSNTQDLANYGLADAVTFYADIRVGPYLSWEIIDDAIYTSDGFTSASADLTKLEVGNIVRTRHTTRCWGVIRGIDLLTGKVTVGNWAVSGGSSYVTPANGTGLYVNPVDKGWAGNLNLIIDSNTRASQNSGGVILEMGIQNKGISNPVALNGLHIPLLAGSTYGATAAILVTGNTDVSWVYGASISGCRTAIWSAGNTRGFVSANDATGYIFYTSGAGVYSYVVRDGSAVGTIQFGINDKGQIVRAPKSSVVANGSYSMATLVPLTLHATTDSGHVYTLPTGAVINDEYTIVTPFNGSTLTVQTSDGSLIHTPTGGTSTSILVSGGQELRARLLVDGWYLCGLLQNAIRGSAQLVFTSRVIAANSYYQTTVPTSAALLGMFIEQSPDVDTGIAIIQSRVSSDGVISIVYYNPSNADLTVPAHTLKMIFKYRS